MGHTELQREGAEAELWFHQWGGGMCVTNERGTLEDQLIGVREGEGAGSGEDSRQRRASACSWARLPMVRRRQRSRGSLGRGKRLPFIAEWPCLAILSLLSAYIYTKRGRRYTLAFYASALIVGPSKKQEQQEQQLYKSSPNHSSLQSRFFVCFFWAVSAWLEGKKIVMWTNTHQHKTWISI